MPISLITGPANAGKARLVMDSLRRELARGREPLLVVPTRADADYYLRELAGDGAVTGVRVERFSGLIEEAVQRAGVRGPRLEGIARERVLHSLAQRNGVHRPSAGYLRALGELFAELQMRRASPGRFAGAIAAWAEADGEEEARTRLGRIYSDYRATLERIGRADTEQQAVRALDVLRERPAQWGASPVLFYGFDDLTPLQLDAIETLGRLVDAEVTVSLAYEPGRIAFAGRAGVFQELLPLSPDAPSIVAASRHDADGFLAGELERRQALSYPPFASLIRVTCSAEEAADANAAADAVRVLVSAPGAVVLGPAPLFRLRGRERSQLIVKAAQRRPAVASVAAAVDAVARTPAGSRAQLSADVDPQ